MGPVIACVDGSDLSRPVVRVAQRLADGLDLGLMLLHVAPPARSPGVSAAPGGQQRLHEEMERDAQELLEQVALDLRVGDDVGRRALVGRAADRIVATCAEEQAALVVLGSRGRGGLKAALLGSVSSDVASRAPCPCVIVSQDAAQTPLLS